MTPIQKAAQEYLAMRRALGYKLRHHGQTLRKFAAFLKEEGASHITIKMALSWVQNYTNGSLIQRTIYLSHIRGFAQYWSATDPLTEVPPKGLLPFHYTRKPPYIYKEDEIRSLVEAFNQIRTFDDLTRRTCSAVAGLLAVTGLRARESLHLHRDDVDFANGVLTIRMTKFKKSRLIPLHPSTTAALQQYARHRDQVHPSLTTPHFFISRTGGPLSYTTLCSMFIKASCQIGLRCPGDRFGPRLHDLRHTFAVTTLLDWYRRGKNVEQCLPILSTYLGHAVVSDTYWYLTGVPELLSLTAKRLQKRWEDL